MKPENVNTYINAFPKTKRAMLQQLREIIRDALPESTEALKWGKPAILSMDDMILVIFAGYTNHMNLVVTPSARQTFAGKLSSYATGKGSIQFSYSTPLPVELIREIVLYRASEYRERGVKWR